MKTIMQSLLDEIPVPVKRGKVENIIIRRGLDADSYFSFELSKLSQYRGAIADCLLALIEEPNFSESDISISYGDKSLIIKRANAIFSEIGEDDKIIGEPRVYIGG